MSNGCELGCSDGSELGPLSDREQGPLNERSRAGPDGQQLTGCQAWLHEGGLELGLVPGWDKGRPDANRRLAGRGRRLAMAASWGSKALMVA